MYLQNQKMQNFFPVPNEIFSLGLTDGEILVYTFLMRCEDRKTFKCHPSYATICEAIGRSKNSVKKYVQGLEKKGLIFTESTKVNTRDGRVHNGSLCYTILPIRDVIERHYEMQLEMARLESARAKAQEKLERYDKKHRKTAV